MTSLVKKINSSLLVCIQSFTICSYAYAAQNASIKNSEITKSDSYKIKTQISLAELEQQIRQMKNFEGILAKLQELLAKEPHNAQAHFLAGMIFEKTGYAELASQEFAEADKYDPSAAKSVLNIFKLKLESGDLLGANSFLTYVSKRFPNDPSILLMQAIMALRQGDKFTAELKYEEALAKNPNVPGVATAFAVFKLSQKKYKEAIELADKDLKLKSKHDGAILTKAKALMELGRVSSAIPLLLQVYNSSGLDKKLVSDLLCEAYEQRGNYLEALEPALFSLALTRGDDKAELAHVKSKVSYLISVLPERVVINTINSLEQKLSELGADPYPNAILLFALGDVFDVLNRKVLAEKFFVEGLKFMPNTGRPYYRIGRIRELSGDFRTAKLFYLRAYELEPSNAQIQAAFVRSFERQKVLSRDIAWQIKERLRRLKSYSKTNV